MQLLRGIAIAEISKAPHWDLRSKLVGSTPGHPSNFSILNCKKINKVPSVKVMVICSDLCRVYGRTFIKILACSGAAEPPPFFAVRHAPPFPFLPCLRDGTDVRVLYILIDTVSTSLESLLHQIIIKYFKM